ncbi:MAG: cysteine protease [Candidatus Lokiarchaeota archaeon]|nr:cysteine protease [Candidatus Lokiarchaeota archaeon]MBD3343261.1 cysteine protease [Candidatus Lokiarchaeota archaeon]
MELDRYLQSSYFFDFHKKKVNQKALEITEGLEHHKEKAIALFYWVRDQIKYKQGSFYLTKSTFKASNNIRRGYGFCVSKAVLLSTLARAVGIPARIHLADIINHKIPQKIVDYMSTNIFYIHGYSELFLGGKWIKVTPAFDKKTTERGDYVLVDFDGEHDALFSEYDDKGNRFVEYLRDRGTYEDVPYDEICEVIMDKYKNMLQKAFKS